jgi:hypothetical protein
MKVPKRWRTTRRSKNESGIPDKLSPLEPVRRSSNLFKVKTSKRCANTRSLGSGSYSSLGLVTTFLPKNTVRSPIFTRPLGSGSYSSLGLVANFLPTPCHCSSVLAAASPNLVTSLVSAVSLVLFVRRSRMCYLMLCWPVLAIPAETGWKCSIMLLPSY